MTKQETKKKQFEKLYSEWVNSYIFSAHGCFDPASEEPCQKLKNWCTENKEDAVKFIKEMLEEEPNDVVMILQHLYGDTHFGYTGFLSLEKICNLWLNILNNSIKNGKIKDYYKDYRKWKNYLKKHYMPWRPNLENDPNVTQKEFKAGQRNGEERRSYHDFSLSAMKDPELLELYSKGYLTNPQMMLHIKELKPFYKQIEQILKNKNIIS